MALHDPQNPRHGRIFELLRQTDAAVDVTYTVQTVEAPVDIDALKHDALRSWDRADGSPLRAKAGRHHKLF